jgi:high-affinity Fe2+/Pb2+ permease
MRFYVHDLLLALYSLFIREFMLDVEKRKPRLDKVLSGRWLFGHSHLFAGSFSLLLLVMRGSASTSRKQHCQEFRSNRAKRSIRAGTISKHAVKASFADVFVSHECHCHEQWTLSERIAGRLQLLAIFVVVSVILVICIVIATATRLAMKVDAR